MTPSEFDFRILDKKKGKYVENLAFSPKGKCLLQDNGEWYSWDDTELLEIEPYIGQRDSKGKRIYVGDILKIKIGFEYEAEAEVFMENALVKLKSRKVEICGFSYDEIAELMDEVADFSEIPKEAIIEVIGDIHEEALNCEEK